MMRLLMLPVLAGFLAIAGLALPAGPGASAASAATAQDGQRVKAKPAARAKARASKRRTARVPRGYGFLPGVRTPGEIERQREADYWRSRPPWYGPAFPRYHNSRWNGGGYGPCYTSTPIGYIWNCGR